MHRFLILTALFAGSALITSMPLRADDRRDRQYYDRNGHDYHTWNGQEDRAYRVYLGERHRDYREFHKTKNSQQKEYFKWRHDHPDNVLFKLEIK
jgi:hypothetical protein